MPTTCAWRACSSGLGITKVRLTGGEPLLRSGLVDMVRELGAMRTLEGEPLDIALTTNGHLLADLAQPLADAGLSRVTVSDGCGRTGTLRAHHPRAQRLTSACWPAFALRNAPV